MIHRLHAIFISKITRFVHLSRSSGFGASKPQQMRRLRYSFQLTLRTTSGGSGVPPHRDSLLLLQNILEVGGSARELPSIDGLGSLAGVLEGDSEVAAASPGGLCVVDLGCCVADLQLRRSQDNGK